jgi:hypothetical protein
MRSVRRRVLRGARASYDPGPAHEGELPGELSTLSLQLHLCSALVSAFTDRPGFVSDEFLAAIADDITLAVIELNVTGLWRRQANGYQIPARHLRRVVAMLHEM